MANKSRPKQLSFRVSEEEYQQLQEKISKSGKNQQEYILSCVLEKQIVNTDGIKELIPELKRIGNNLNQIAKRCNEGGMLPSEAEVRNSDSLQSAAGYLMFADKRIELGGHLRKLPMGYFIYMLHSFLYYGHNQSWNTAEELSA